MKFMYFLTYISKATETGAAALKDIVEKARLKNRKNGLTGVLLFRSQIFFQLLEGAKKDVLNTFQKIAGDGRHKNIEVLFEAEIDGAPRIFPSWEMGLISEPFADSKQEVIAESLQSIVLSASPEKETILDLLQEFSATIPLLSARDILAKAATDTVF